MPEIIDWEYRTENADRIAGIREHLHRRFKQGWRLYCIEGKVLRFRRRTKDCEI